VDNSPLRSELLTYPQPLLRFQLSPAQIIENQGKEEDIPVTLSFD